jgi:molybdopterin converting factor small subunit
MVAIRIPSAMRALVGGEARVEADGGTVREVLEEASGRHPGLGDRLFAEPGKVRRFVNVFVDDEDIRHRQGLDTPVGDGQVVSILPAVAGG